MKHRLFRSRPSRVASLTLCMAVGLLLPLPAPAHEAKCPVCKLDVVQDTPRLDNEVALKSGRKRIEYRCVLCALRDAPSYAGDITILAPSEVKGRPVTLTRKAGEWSVTPAAAVFVAHRVEHRHCQLGYRALTSPEAFPKWVAAHREVLQDAVPVKLPELLALARTER
jgi:hypothetical protein